jgi:hypothetical protein
MGRRSLCSHESIAQRGAIRRAEGGFLVKIQLKCVEFARRSPVVRRQIVQYDPNALRFRKVNVGEFAHAGGEVYCGTAVGDFDLAPGSMHIEEDEQVGRRTAPPAEPVFDRPYATFALKAGVWFRRGRLVFIASPDSRGTVPVVRQKRHLSSCADFRDRHFPLCPPALEGPALRAREVKSSIALENGVANVGD